MVFQSNGPSSSSFACPSKSFEFLISIAVGHRWKNSVQITLARLQTHDLPQITLDRIQWRQLSSVNPGHRRIIPMPFSSSTSSTLFDSILVLQHNSHVMYTIIFQQPRENYKLSWSAVSPKKWPLKKTKACRAKDNANGHCDSSLSLFEFEFENSKITWMVFFLSL